MKTGHTFGLIFERKADLESAIHAALLFLATLFFANEYYYLLLPLGVLCFKFKWLIEHKSKLLQEKKIRNTLILALFYVSVSYLNKLCNGYPISTLQDSYASFLLFPILLVTAALMNLKKVFTFFIYFVALECLLGFFEYHYEVRSFFIEGARINQSSNYLYDHRVNGMSISSSVFALKILVAVIAIEFALVKNRLKLLLKGFLCCGILLSFNRALILSVLLFWIVLFLYQVIKSNSYRPKKILSFATNMILFTGVFFMFSKQNIWTEMQKKNPEEKQLQLAFKDSRNLLRFSDFQETAATIKYPVLKEGNALDTSSKIHKLFYKSTQGINTSGRTLIWMNYLEYIEHHMWFGFGSNKLLFKAIDQDNHKIKLIHAHNSLLQIVSSNGLLISILFIIIVFYIWTKKNFILLLPILAFSCFQYGIFWGFSLLDVFFFSILMYNSNLLNEK